MEKKRHEHSASLEATEETERPGPLIYGLETESSFFWKVGDSRPHFGSDSIKNMSSCKSCQKKWVSAVSPPARRPGCAVCSEFVRSLNLSFPALLSRK